MRHLDPRSQEASIDSRVSSGGTAVDLRPADIRRLPEGQLIAELADLEERIRLLDPGDDAGEVGRLTMQDLVEAEYTILHELRRRQTPSRHGIRWNTLRLRRFRSD